MLWQIRLSVCRLWRACTLLRGFNFSGIYHIVAWPSGNSPTKNHESRPRGSPLRANLPNRRVAVWLFYGSQTSLTGQISSSHVWLSHLLMSFMLSYTANKQTNVRTRKCYPRRSTELAWVRSTCGRRASFEVCSWFSDLQLSHRQSTRSIVVHWQFSPTSVMMAGVCPSVRLSVACLNLTRERKGLKAENWQMEARKLI